MNTNMPNNDPFGHHTNPHYAAPRRGIGLSVALGFLAGCVVFGLAAPADEVVRIAQELKASVSNRFNPAAGARTRSAGTKKKGDVALRALAKHGDKAVATSEALAKQLPSAGGAFYVTGKALGDFFSEASKLVYGKVSGGAPGTAGQPQMGSALGILGIRASLKGTPVVITRGQFLDVVSNRMPSSLPTSNARDGALFHSLAETEVNGRVLAKALDEQDIAQDALCNPRRLDPKSFARLTLVFHATRANLDCVKVFLSQEVGQATGAQPRREITLIALSAGDGYYAARESLGTTLTLQTWDGAWLESIVASWDDDVAAPVTTRRARRLASLARALTRASDVVVDVPLSQTPSPFGNFVALPRGIATGTLRVRRVGESVQKSKGKEAAWTLTEATSLLIVSGVGKGLKFESVDKR